MKMETARPPPESTSEAGEESMFQNHNRKSLDPDIRRDDADSSAKSERDSSRPKIVYTREEMLALSQIPASKKKPAGLNNDFMSGPKHLTDARNRGRKNRWEDRGRKWSDDSSSKRGDKYRPKIGDRDNRGGGGWREQRSNRSRRGSDKDAERSYGRRDDRGGKRRDGYQENNRNHDGHRRDWDRESEEMPEWAMDEGDDDFDFDKANLEDDREKYKRKHGLKTKEKKPTETKLSTNDIVPSEEKRGEVASRDPSDAIESSKVDKMFASFGRDLKLGKNDLSSAGLGFSISDRRQGSQRSRFGFGADGQNSIERRSRFGFKLKQDDPTPPGFPAGEENRPIAQLQQQLKNSNGKDRDGNNVKTNNTAFTQRISDLFNKGSAGQTVTASSSSSLSSSSTPSMSKRPHVPTNVDGNGSQQQEGGTPALPTLPDLPNLYGESPSKEHPPRLSEKQRFLMQVKDEKSKGNIMSQQRRNVENVHSAEYSKQHGHQNRVNYYRNDSHQHAAAQKARKAQMQQQHHHHQAYNQYPSYNFNPGVPPPHPGQRQQQQQQQQQNMMYQSAQMHSMKRAASPQQSQHQHQQYYIERQQQMMRQQNVQQQQRQSRHQQPQIQHHPNHQHPPPHVNYQPPHPALQQWAGGSRAHSAPQGGAGEGSNYAAAAQSQRQHVYSSTRQSYHPEYTNGEKSSREQNDKQQFKKFFGHMLS